MQELAQDRLSSASEHEAFRVMFEHAGFGVAHVSLDGEWLAVNQALCDMLGYSRPQLLRKILPEVTRFDDLEAELAECRRLRSGEIASFSSEKRHLRGDGRVVWLKAAVTLVRDEDTSEPASYLAIVEDVTPQRKAIQQILLDSDKRFRVLTDNISDLFFTFDCELNCTHWNKAAENLTGLSPRSVIGRSLDQVLSQALNSANSAAAIRAVFETQRPNRFSLPCKLADQDVLFEVTAYPVKDGISVVAKDLTASREAELARADLSRRLMNAQEAERARIARELHDGIGQSLALLSVQLLRAGKPTSSGKTGPGIAELCGKLKDIGHQVSRLSHQLHSSELEFLGLAVAIKSLCREFSEQYPIKVECDCTDIPSDLDGDVALGFLRVVQEALHNIAKHSRASEVHVAMSFAGGDLLLNLADNGVGFDKNEVRDSPGLGMVSMRERMHLIGGGLVITSQAGGGTRILARAPAMAGRG